MSPAAKDGIVIVILLVDEVVAELCVANVRSALAPYHSLKDMAAPAVLSIKPIISASFIPAEVAVDPPASICISFREMAPDV
tara:strand:+ start:5331 stop:5576 length:246 start_codon:yes stop_codon:yes gene_type:complete